ncbi:uncharacterized protein B0P05DRAFT_552165 [Gilbertella persicaria]|uniref:TNF receptor-associated factor 6 n=1 Tax=Rhizopus stolonifer TaxID=4846 RepID=A0A367IPJ4_RHIST|nr:uncharacterized protein B0P05DRAFT_552165 [Gilbertella persicaria]KAI8068179.1 hypothetical protein B0P05DRAFT_552165 [Gilbertella persicaria]RCH79559.1 hypothetical protein CU098_005120 [Rhizopus stolonifer]
MDIDLRTLCYVDHVNDNLICCICQQPFIEPVISTCGHTFCHHCILQALENSPHCPIDRTALTAHDVEPAAKIITNMVNELSVYCPRQEQGCPYQGQRQYIESHLKQDCQYIMAPCELEECKELLLKKDLSTHAETCNYRVMECNMCKKKLCAYEMEDHYNLCPSEIMTCPYCDTSRPRSEHNAHLHDCPQLTVSCHHSESGCPWSDQRRYLDVHLSTCVYESIQPFLHKQQQVEKSLRAELAQVHKENESLKRYQLESNQQIEFITRQLDLMFPGHFMSDVPQDARNESVLAENQRISHELETLNANMASLELKQNVALMTETFRLQEELQSLRAICHGLRMQMHYLMMERRTQASTSTTNANGNDVATTNALNRMRTWLGK